MKKRLFCVAMALIIMLGIMPGTGTEAFAIGEEVTLQPSGGTAPVGEKFEITYATNFEYIQARLYEGTPDGYSEFSQMLAQGSDLIRARNTATAVTFYVQFEIRNGVYINSSPFQVVWDYSTFSIITQPVGGTAMVGEGFPITYETNFAYTAKLFKGTPDGHHEFAQMLGEGGDTITARNFQTTETFFVQFEVIGKHYINSSPFDVTWDYSACQVTEQPASGTAPVGEAYEISYATNCEYTYARLFEGTPDGHNEFVKMLAQGSDTVPAHNTSTAVTYFVQFEIASGIYLDSGPFQVVWDYSTFSIITQPVGGTATVGEGFPITYETNFAYTARLYRGTPDGSNEIVQVLAEGGDTITARNFETTETFFVQFEVIGNHYINSSPFDVTWDYSAYQVTTQPAGGTAAVGEDYEISYATNFQYTNARLYEGTPDGHNEFVKMLAQGSDTVPAHNTSTAVTYFVQFEIASGSYLNSNPFQVVWDYSTFSIITQPVGGTATVGEGFPITYETNFAYTARLYRGTPDGYKQFAQMLAESGDTITARNFQTTETFFVQFEVIGNHYINSSPFDVTWVEYVNVTFDANGGSGSMNPVSAIKGRKYTLPACGFTAPANKEFDRWDKGTPGTEIDITGDTVIKAQWKDLLWNITFDANGGSGSMPADTVVRGQKYTLPECTLTAPSNKEFDRWDKGSPGDQISITADTVIKALWKDLTWTITFDAGEGSGSMAPATVVRGQQYMLPNCSFTAPADRAFDRWDKGNPGEKIDVTGDTVVTALWKDRPLVPETWTITFEAGEGSGIMAAAVVNRGEKYTLPACSFTAPANKVFDQWDKGAPGTQIDIYADTVVTAMWKDKPAAPASSGPVEKITFSKLKKVKLTALSTKKLKITWKKLSKKDQKKIQKIQIDYSTDKTFKTGVKTRWAKKGKASYTIKGLKKNTKYWVRIRAWKKDGNIIYVSKWVTKNKKTKKK